MKKEPPGLLTLLRAVGQGTVHLAPAAPSPGRRHDKMVAPTRALGSPQSSLPWTERTKSVWPRRAHTYTHVHTYAHTVQEEGRQKQDQPGGPTSPARAPPPRGKRAGFAHRVQESTLFLLLPSPCTFTQALRSGQAQEWGQKHWRS